MSDCDMNVDLGRIVVGKQEPDGSVGIPPPPELPPEYERRRHPDSEILQEPVRRQAKRTRWAVLVHEPDIGTSTNMGTYRWRWMAVRAGHTHRRFHPGPKTVEIRRVPPERAGD